MKKNENIEWITYNIEWITYLEPFSKQDVKKFSPLTAEEIDKVLKSIDDSLKIMNENLNLWIDFQYVKTLYWLEDYDYLDKLSKKVVNAILYCKERIIQILNKENDKEETLKFVLRELVNFYEFIELKKKELIEILNKK